MRPLPSLLVALLFVAATVIPVAGIHPATERTETVTGPVQSVTAVDNTTNQLTVPADAVRRSNYNETGIDISTSAEAWSAQLHHRHDSLAFEAQFRQTESNLKRSQLIDTRLATIEAKHRALDRRQDTAVSRYARGEISPKEFLRTRLVIHAEATELLETLDRVAAVPDAAPDYTPADSLTTRLRTTEGELKTLTGPIGSRLQSGVAASDSGPIYLEASDSGYTLATVAGDQYVRETRLDDARNGTLPDEFLSTAVNDGNPGTDRLDIAGERAANLYPWLYERQRPSFTFYGTSGIYELTANHPNGELTAYLDGGTTDIFYEQQFRDLSNVRTRGTEQNVTDSLRVTVQRSSDTGPLLVSAANNETGAVVDGRVLIDGRSVGTTGSDGLLWTVEPRGSYTVTVATDSSRTNVTVRDI
ncbi:hypothetical protein NDI56_10795 [Haloarcula sp. S1CR25-12]|uniref:PEGA domain-containing protein n=1 Tax=Haloarcula saliterrae TaxID=2950534 RepID=A0ABU2FDT4_9EURY|nr:hypothetical protein [Haloarcula sp. S1CR25-12]MDS0259880.1 hypothetical protein [Haloarcula sp. S1CR25-12]